MASSLKVFATICLGASISFASVRAAKHYGYKERIRKHFEDKKKKIVVVGAGYAGRSFLKDINTDIYDVVFVDKKLKIETDVWFNDKINKIVFEPQPNYVDTLSEGKVVTQFAVIHNSISNVQGEVVNVNKDEQTVTLKDDKKLNYDYLVWATGSVPDTFNVKMNYDCSSKMWYYFKDIDDVKALMTAINLVGLDNVVVMGGGTTGVELASEISKKIAEVKAKNGEAKSNKAHVTILEPSDRLLPKLKPAISEQVTEYLKKQHINIITGANIQEINSGTIKLVRNGTEDITLKAVIAVWTCGVKPDELLTKLLGTNEVTDNLLLCTKNSKNQRLYNIFAIGDCNNQLPKSAQHSKQQGKYLADFLNNLGFQNPDAKSFKFESQGQMIRLSDRVFMDSPVYTGMLPLFVHRAIIALDL